MEDLSQFEAFLMLDDVQGSQKEVNERMLANIQQNKAEQQEIDIQLDDIDEPHDSGTDVSDDEFKSYLEENGLIFEGEDGFDFEKSSLGQRDKPDEDNVESEEEEQEEVEQSTEEAQEAPDDQYDDYPLESVDVDLDTILTLPDGRNVSVEELQNSYLADEVFFERQQKFEQMKQQIEEERKTLDKHLDLATISVDRELAQYRGVDWDDLAATNPQAYIENSRYYDKLLKQREEVLSVHAQIKAEREAEEAEKFRANSAACVAILEKEIPHWNEAHYEKLMQHALEIGFDEDTILNENRAPVFLLLNKSYEASKAKEAVKAKIMRPGSPKNAMRSGGVTNKAKVEDLNRAKIAKAYSEGRMTSEQAFAFLED